MASTRRQFYDALFDKKTMRKIYPHRDSALRAYLQDIGTFPLLTAEQERRLLTRVAQGDREALQQLIEANLRLVIVIAAHFQGRGLSLMDLIQEGNLGLIAAIERFDGTKSNRLSTYAKYRIVQAIGRSVAERGKAIHTPYSTAQRIQAIERAVSEFLHQGIEPTTSKIAERIGLSVEQSMELLALMQEPISLEQQEGERDPFTDVVEAPPLFLSNEVLSPSLMTDVTQMIDDVLTEDERQVIKHLFGLTQEGIVYDYHEIASKLYHRTGPRVDVRIRQLERHALAKLRAACNNGEA